MTQTSLKYGSGQNVSNSERTCNYRFELGMPADGGLASATNVEFNVALRALCLGLV